jgi:hypothetical protein
LRKGINPAFRPQALLDLESTIQERLFEFVRGLTGVAAKNQGKVDMSQWFNYLSYDVLLRFSDV